MKRPSDCLEKGLTLMELLIALSLFAAIMSFLMNSFFQFQRQSERMESILRIRQETRTLERLIREDILAVVYLDEYMKDPLNEQDDRKSGVYGIDEVSGERDRDIIHMHVARPAKFHRGLPFGKDPEIHEVSYYLEETADGSPSFKRREEFYVDDDITDGERSVIYTLSENMISFNIKYYAGNNSESVDEWDSKLYEETKDKNMKIPSGVEITMELQNKSGESVKSTLNINIHPYMGLFAGWE